MRDFYLMKQIDAKYSNTKMEKYLLIYISIVRIIVVNKRVISIHHAKYGVDDLRIYAPSDGGNEFVFIWVMHYYWNWIDDVP